MSAVGVPAQDQQHQLQHQLQQRETCAVAALLGKLPGTLALLGLVHRAAAALRSERPLQRLTLSGALILLGWAAAALASRSGGAGGASDALGAVHPVAMTAAAVVSGLPLARRAWEGLRARAIGIELLVAVAAAGAVVIAEYWEAAAVTFLFDLGGYLEWKTLERARSAIRALAALSPSTARVRRPDGSEEEVPVEAVRPGDPVVIRSGEKVPADGVVVRGEAEVNEAALTGEPVPVSKTAGDNVMAGSLLALGFVEVRATRVGEETTFGRILRLVGEAQEAKAPVQRTIERFARYYTPAIIALAAVTYAFTRDTHLALTLLVVGCPGAMVLAAPVSVVAGLGRAARSGVLIKGGERLERLASVTALAFDKTGTLTAGRPQVVAVHSIGEPDGLEGPGDQVNPAAHGDRRSATVLRLAAAAEKGSEHHLASAVLERAASDASAGPIPEPEEVRVLPGRGVVARVEGRQVLVGNRRLLEAHGLSLTPPVEALLAAEEQQGRTGVLVAVDGQVAGVLAVADQLRSSARGLADRLRRIGVRETWMLTGDNPKAAAPAAQSAGIDRVAAGLLPDDKVEHLRRLKAQGHTVAMVGDGINDAPALAAADASIAIGAGGTDAAMEAADLALVSDDLGKIPYAIGLARAIVRNIRQNLAFAVIVVLSLVAGVLAGQVHLASGMLVHEVSVLAVILNGMRLLRWQEPLP